MKKSLSIILSLLMIITTVAALPFSASAANDDGQIFFRDEFGAWGVDGYDENSLIDFALYFGKNVEDFWGDTAVVPSYNGASYNAQTNTLTLNNVNGALNAYFVTISNMGDLKIELVGTSNLIKLDVDNTNISIIGNGTLSLNPEKSWTKGLGKEWEEIHTNERILDTPVSMVDSTFTISSNATVYAYNADSAEYGLFEYQFSEPKTEQELNSKYFVVKNVSPSFNWVADQYTEEAWDEYTKVGIHLVLHNFPAENIYVRTDGEEKTLWVHSAMDDHNNSEYSYHQLVYDEAGDIWYESDENNSIFKYRSGQYYAVSPEGWYENTPTEGVSFARFGDMDPAQRPELPSTLADNGVVAASLLMKYDYNNDFLFTSGDLSFALHYGGYTNFVNKNVNASFPASTAYSGYDMFYIREAGNIKYLEYCERITDSTSEQDAINVAKDKGYTPKSIHHDAVTTYYYRIPLMAATLKGEAQQEVQPVVQHVHSYTETVVNPSCTAQGYTVHTCACGDTYQDNYVNATGHNWDGGKVTTEPTAMDKGVKTFTCKNCGATRTEEIAKYKATTANPVKVEAVKATPTVKASVLKKKDQTIPLKKVAKVKKAKGKVTYSKKSGNKKIKIDEKTGKVTLKKGLKKGTYTVKVKVQDHGTKKYKAKASTVTFKIKVK